MKNICFTEWLHNKKLARLEAKMKRKTKEAKIKAAFQKNSHSLLWVWEFSKKAVLICFIFYMIIQIYAMVVMVKQSDYSSLSDLINQSGEIVKDCVFAYFIKAGLENLVKIHSSKNKNESEE